MISKLTFSLGISFLSLLLLHRSNGLDKAEFGEKFRLQLLNETLKLARISIKSGHEFILEIHNEMKPSESQEVMLESELDKLDEMNKIIAEENDDVKQIEVFKELKQNYIQRIGKYATIMEIKDENQVEVVKRASGKYIEKVETAAEEYTKDLVRYWQDLYEMLPEEEIKLYPGFENINERIVNMEENDLQHGFLETLGEIYNFFGYTKWEAILNV